MLASLFFSQRSLLVGPALLASVAGLLTLTTGVARAQTVDFSSVDLASVSSASGQDFAVSSGGTVNVRLLSGDASGLGPGSSPDTTGFYVLQSDPDLNPVTFRFSLSTPQSFTISQNEGLTTLENNAFTLTSGSWSVLSSSDATVANTGLTVSFQGTSDSPPYGDYQIQGAGSSFDFTVANSPGFPVYGSAISLNLNGPVAGEVAAPEPSGLALLAVALPAIGVLIVRRRRA